MEDWGVAQHTSNSHGHGKADTERERERCIHQACQPFWTTKATLGGLANARGELSRLLSLHNAQCPLRRRAETKSSPEPMARAQLNSLSSVRACHPFLIRISPVVTDQHSTVPLFHPAFAPIHAWIGSFDNRLGPLVDAGIRTGLDVSQLKPEQSSNQPLR
ncbi:hypothetical protein AC579_3392 [Pseudocercospora musae]|uniref:Uncharacterized protein n=1 Tax=Pseudocercospora musae TaxID=113226 RepID=A0A139ILH4_9PEZI|nr:hypothetical protein AC579_3392 [Pseudocercospora musae]